jgi:hypothetical protein
MQRADSDKHSIYTIIQVENSITIVTDLFGKGSSILQQLIVCSTLDYLPEPNNKTTHTGSSAAQIQKKHVAPSIPLYTGFVNSIRIHLYRPKSIP